MKKQLQKLSDQIYGNIPATGNKIYVFPIEAGVGKTSEMIKTLKQIENDKPDVKSIIITKFKDEAIRIGKELGENCIVLVDTIKDFNIVSGKQVVIITHSRYINLCKPGENNEENWETLSRDRKNLIIDEEIQMDSLISINYEEYYMAKNCVTELDATLGRQFHSVFIQIFFQLLKIKNGAIKGDTIFKPHCLDIEQNRILRKIKNKISDSSNKYFFYQNLKNINNVDCRDSCFATSFMELNDIFIKLEIILQSEFCICNDKSISCLDRTKFNLLENNILLDASASINLMYKNNSLFKVVSMDRIRNYDNWELYVCNINSSKRKKMLNTPFYKGSMLQAEKICENKNNKLLIFSSKEEVGNGKNKGQFELLYNDFFQRYNDQISFTNFEAMRGKNTWADFNNVLCIHTYYLPSNYTILKFHALFPDYLLKNTDFKMGSVGSNENRHFGFINCKELDDFRESEFASTYYQAITRINRKNDQKARVFLILKNKNLINILLKNLKGISLKEFKLPNQEELMKKARKPYYRKNESPVKIKLKQLLIEMAEGKYSEFECSGLPGYYTKQWCMSMVGCKSHYSRYLDGLEEFMLLKGITHNQHKIIISK